MVCELHLSKTMINIFLKEWVRMEKLRPRILCMSQLGQSLWKV